MKRIGIREFKTKATSLIADEKALVIERHGKPVGFYIPIVPKDKAKAKEAADRLQVTIDKVLERTGMSEDELIEFMTKDWEQSVRDAPRG